jgi:2-desacetyl-2-hydroxyethyl bacteriochlorophyllide A dehydrogenase
VDDYDALVQIVACGVCTGTDLHILQGNFPWLVPYPFVLGHESVGRVISVGSRVRHINEGDLVLRPVAFRAGDHGSALGALWGGYAEYGIVADTRSIIEDSDSSTAPPLPQFAAAQQVVPADFDPIDAGMFITFKETLSWIQQLGNIANKSVVVLGTGPVGLCFVRLAKFLGANPVIAVGRRQARLKLAVQMGADATINTSVEDLASAVRQLTDGLGADYIIEAIGNTELLRQAIYGLTDQGELAVYGVPPALEASVAWSGTAPNWKLRFIKPREEAVHDLALDLVQLGFIDLKSFVSHVMPLSQIDEAFRRVADKDALKIVITNDA